MVFQEVDFYDPEQHFLERFLEYTQTLKSQTNSLDDGNDIARKRQIINQHLQKTFSLAMEWFLYKTKNELSLQPSTQKEIESISRQILENIQSPEFIRHNVEIETVFSESTSFTNAEALSPDIAMCKVWLINMVQAHHDNLLMVEDDFIFVYWAQVPQKRQAQFQAAMNDLKMHLNTCHTHHPSMHYFVQAIQQEMDRKYLDLSQVNQDLEAKLSAFEEFDRVLRCLNHTLFGENTDGERDKAVQFGEQMLQFNRYKKLGQLFMGLGAVLLITTAIAAGLTYAALLGPSLYGIQMSAALLNAAALSVGTMAMGTSVSFFAEKRHHQVLEEGYQQLLEEGYQQLLSM